MKLAILSRNGKLYSTKRLVDAARVRGHSVRVLDPLRCYMRIAGDGFSMHYKGHAIAGYGAVIPRIGASVTRYGCAVLHQFELMGSYTPNLVAPLGIRLPVYPIKGYSLTVPITDESVAPVSTVMDETYKVATTRFADRIRVGGTAEIAGWDMTLRPHRRGPLERSLHDAYEKDGVTLDAFIGPLRRAFPSQAKVDPQDSTSDQEPRLVVDGLSLLLQVTNLTNSPDSTVQVATLANNVPLTRPWDYNTWGRTVLFGINYKL